MTVSLVSGNTRTLYIGKQSAQGTAQTTPTVKLRVTDCSLDPNRTIIRLPESDSSAQEAQDVVVSAEPGGQFTCWLRPNDCDLLLYGLQGSTSSSGSTNYTHTLNPSTSPPYFTIYDVIPGVSTTQYVDCRFVSGTFSGGAGQGLSGQFTVQALSAYLNQTEPVSPSAYQTDRPLVYPDVTVTRDGTHSGDVDAFTLTMNRGGQYFHGDNGLLAADRPIGLYGVEGSMTLAFQNAQEYSSFNTGATNGTNLTTSIYNQPLTVLAAIDSNTSIQWASSAIEFTSYPIPVNTDGSPITVAAGFRTKPQATFSDNMAVTVKNQKATPTS